MGAFLAHLFNPSRTCFDTRVVKYNAFDRNESIRDESKKLLDKKEISSFMRTIII